MKRIAEARVNHFYPDLTLRLPVRQDLHLTRKLWHFGMGLFIVFCYLAGTSQSSAVLILSLFLGASIFTEKLRLKSASFNEKIMRYWGPLMRSNEVKQMSTTPHYIASSMIVIGIFPKPVAVLSILYLACGDPIASFFGILWGHYGPKLHQGKSLIGTIAGVLTCSLVTLIYLKAQGVGMAHLWTLTLIGGLAGGLVELLPFDVDDNFTIPVVSGFVLWLSFIILGI